jgi:hypothetical protein
MALHTSLHRQYEQRQEGQFPCFVKLVSGTVHLLLALRHTLLEITDIHLISAQVDRTAASLWSE